MTTQLKSALIVMLLFLIIPLGLLALQGSYTRMHADDFCIAADATRMDMVDFFNKWYRGWTGRFTYLVSAGLLALGGPQLASLLPPVAMSIWFICLAWAVLPVINSMRLPRPIFFAILFSGFFLLVLLSATPNRFQSVFWKDGLINHTFPLIGLTLNIGLLLRAWLGSQKLRKCVYFLVFMLAFLSGGFSEVFSTTQIAFFTLLVLYAIIAQSPRLKAMSGLFVAAWIGSLGAYAIVLAAPGNLVRREIISTHPDFFRLVTFSLRNALVIIAKYFLFTPGWAIPSVLAPFLLGFGFFGIHSIDNSNGQSATWSVLKSKTWFQAGILVPLTAFVLTVAACAPVVYMLNAYPDDRTILIPLYFIILAAIISSSCFGYGLRQFGKKPKKIHPMHLQRLCISGAMVLVAVSALLTIIPATYQLPEYQDYALRWDERHALLQQYQLESRREAAMYGLESRFGISDLRIEETYWVNRCMAGYYGLGSIIGK